MTASDVLQLLAILAFLCGLGLVLHEVFGIVVMTGVLLMLVAVVLWFTGAEIDRRSVLLGEVRDR